MLLMNYLAERETMINTASGLPRSPILTRLKMVPNIHIKWNKQTTNNRLCRAELLSEVPELTKRMSLDNS